MQREQAHRSTLPAMLVASVGPTLI